MGRGSGRRRLSPYARDQLLRLIAEGEVAGSKSVPRYTPADVRGPVQTETEGTHLMSAVKQLFHAAKHI